MKDKSTLVSLAVMCALSAGNIAFAESGIWNVGAGKAVDIAGTNAEAYQVTGLSMTKNGEYIVQAQAAGFQSDITADVTFDSNGEIIQAVKIVGQGETDGVGTKVADAAFTDQFAGAGAPVGLKGKEIAVVSPATGAAVQAEAGAEPAAEAVTEEAAGKSNPAEWNASDKSAEAEAQRALYAAGLTKSAMENQPLTTPAADASAEEQAVMKLERAGLLTVEAEAAEEAAEAVSVSLTEFDAVSGATISSTAVVTAVNNAYFFLHEEVLAQ